MCGACVRTSEEDIRTDLNRPTAGRLNRKTDRRHTDRVWTDINENASAAPLSRSPCSTRCSTLPLLVPLSRIINCNHVLSRDFDETQRCALPVRDRGCPAQRAPSTAAETIYRRRLVETIVKRFSPRRRRVLCRC